VRLDRAALGKGGGEEIEDDRPLLQRIAQAEIERLAGQRRLRAEIRRLGTDRQRGGGWNGKKSGGESGDGCKLHGSDPRGSGGPLL